MSGKKILLLQSVLTALGFAMAMPSDVISDHRSLESRPTFDQQRLTALLGTQPNQPVEYEDIQEGEDEEPIDRKDSGVPAEANEINPFKLLPPQFHDLLNIPIHDYGNGTTYNPYDKYKVPSKNKYPLVSTGYANTKYQGSPLPPKISVENPIRQPKPTRRPPAYKKPTTTTTTVDYEDEYVEEEPTTPKPRPTSTPRYYQRPSSEPPVYRPQYTDEERPQKKPSYTIIGESYEEEPMTEIKVTPKPFMAGHEGSHHFAAPPIEGHVEEVDIIYDYDDERSKGEGVLFMVDKGESLTTRRPRPQQPQTTTVRNIQPYPTVASRPSSNHKAPFRPSQTLNRPEESFRPEFFPSQNPGQRLPQFQQPPPPAFNGFDGTPNGNMEPPRPPFRFPPDQPNQRDGPPPNILPLFRPNANPTDEFQFIKHPQQIDFQRPSFQQGPNDPSFQAQNQGIRPRPGSNQGGINPLPSALQSPFSQISQAVASFFGRRSGSASTGQRSSSADLSSVKSDRFGMAAEESEEEDLVTAESHPFVLFNRRNDPPVSIDRSDNLQQPNVGPEGPQVMGIRADPEGAKPPAFYVYTKSELENGKPPYLVVGPQYGPPPSVSGAQLVHTVPAKPISADRRNDFPAGGAPRPSSPNAIPFPLNPPPLAQQPEVPTDPTRQKPFFPGPAKVNRPSALPPIPGLAPPRPVTNRNPGFTFPESIQTEVPQGIAPTVGGVAPPRVPLNPQKDVASLFSNPTLLVNQPQELAQNQGDVAISKPIVSNPVPNFETALPVRNPLIPSTTPRPTTTTTLNYIQSFNPKAPVKYSTIQQDGKQIAVVHPAYIVTYRYKPGPPDLIDLDAPFVPSVESSSNFGYNPAEPLQEWQQLQDNHRSDTQESGSVPVHSVVPMTERKPDYVDGFVPIVPSSGL